MPDPGPTSELAWALRDMQVAAMTATQALARRLDMADTDLAALQHLATRPNGIGPVELGDLLGIRSASATVLVDRLEQAGHVLRTAHPHDRRRRVVLLTDHSRRTVLRQLADLTSAVDQAASRLTPKEAAAATRFLTDSAQELRRYAADTRAES